MSATHQHLLTALISAVKQEVNVMKSLATTLLGAALLSAATAIAQTPTTPGSAVKGTLIEATVTTTNVPGPVPITYYLPKHYDAKRAEPYPLIIQLHGGDRSNKAMENFSTGEEGVGKLLDQAIENGLVAPMVSVMPSAGRSFYMNFRDGSQKWEDFVMKDLLLYMRKNFNVVHGREGTFITGFSMGGMGSLRMAVKYPEVFQAVASQEPAIEPALAYDDVTLRNQITRPDTLIKQIFGDPIDKDYWAANNPATIIKGDPSRLLGLGMYLEVGDQDTGYWNQGTEFVHRVLFDAGISHEYRLVKGADHVGPSLVPRSLDAFAFIGRQLNPPKWINDAVLRFRASVDENKKARGYPVRPFDPNRIHAE
jgi:S-formylglutathione hydrolase